MKFLVPNYSCLQNPRLGGYRHQIPVLSVLNWIFWTPPEKILGTPLSLNDSYTFSLSSKRHSELLRFVHSPYDDAIHRGLTWLLLIIIIPIIIITINHHCHQNLFKIQGVRDITPGRVFSDCIDPKKEAANSSRILVTVYQSTRRYVSGDFLNTARRASSLASSSFVTTGVLISP